MERIKNDDTFDSATPSLGPIIAFRSKFVCKKGLDAIIGPWLAHPTDVRKIFTVSLSVGISPPVGHTPSRELPSNGRY